MQSYIRTRSKGRASQVKCRFRAGIREDLGLVEGIGLV